MVPHNFFSCRHLRSSVVGCGGELHRALAHGASALGVAGGDLRNLPGEAVEPAMQLVHGAAVEQNLRRKTW